MKATEANFLKFIQNSSQFIVPIYQRTYSWTEKQCRQLWEDILRAGSSDEITVHFIGSIVYVEQGLSQSSRHSPLLVIDGQQRLTTISLLLEALARRLGEEELIEGFSEKKLRHYYLSNPLESGDRFFKLILSQTDNPSLKAIIKNSERPREQSLRISQNFELFSKLLDEENDNLAAVCRGLSKLVIVDIALHRDQDNPQLIFESMNSTGKELSQADLIRNFILMGLEPEFQSRLYEDLWRPMELDFGQEAYGTHFDSFMRHYLTVKTGEIPREREVYEAFKDYSRTKPVLQGGIEALVSDIRRFSRFYCAMALGAETNPRLQDAFQDLRELKVDVAFPFLLELYSDFDQRLLSEEELLSVVRLVESYVFRRVVCSIPTNSMNKTFGTFGKVIRKDNYIESIQAHFLTLPSYRRFPSDEEFRRDLQTKDLYNIRTRSFWLRRIENHGRKERVAVENYTIEHIMPQNPKLSSGWKQALGPDWERIQQQRLHTLGNLTLTGYNSEYSDRDFAEKRDMEGGFKHSPLKLNSGLGEATVWNEAAIQERARRLAEEALAIWSMPKLDEATLERYQSKPIEEVTYTIEDHPYLVEGSNVSGDLIPRLFAAFRKEVLALDPCVREEFTKLYAAYKAETNFVDVVPQAKRLRLSLNMSFSEINDPKKICIDVSNIGRWGNGDVEIGLQSMDELPYVIGLVRQSLEKQLGDGGAV